MILISLKYFNLFKIKRDDHRDSARWSAQSLLSLTSMKIDLPRVQNNNLNSLPEGSGDTGPKYLNSPENFSKAPNLPRLSSGKKHLSVNLVPKNPKMQHNGSQLQPPTFSESFR